MLVACTALPVQVTFNPVEASGARRREPRRASASNGTSRSGPPCRSSMPGPKPLRAHLILRARQGLVDTLSRFKVTTSVGVIDWTKGPVPNVYPTPCFGGRWIKAKPGSKFKLDLVIIDNVDGAARRPVRSAQSSSHIIETRSIGPTGGRSDLPIDLLLSSRPRHAKRKPTIGSFATFAATRVRLLKYQLL